MFELVSVIKKIKKYIIDFKMTIAMTQIEPSLLKKITKSKYLYLLLFVKA